MAVEEIIRVCPITHLPWIGVERPLQLRQLTGAGINGNGVQVQAGGLGLLDPQLPGADRSLLHQVAACHTLAARLIINRPVSANHSYTLHPDQVLNVDPNPPM